MTKMSRLFSFESFTIVGIVGNELKINKECGSNLWYFSFGKWIQFTYPTLKPMHFCLQTKECP